MLELVMLRLNRKHGFTMIEMLCAISLFSFLSLFILSVQLNNLRLKEEGRQKLNYISVVEAIKTELLNNATYNDIVSSYNQNKRYINSSKLSVSTIKNLGLINILDTLEDSRNPYAKLNITNGEVLTVEIELHYKLGSNNEVIRTTMLKGNYL
jgi:prepilin-type N-terminal cleavage/methylation domain-containing protein